MNSQSSPSATANVNLFPATSSDQTSFSADAGEHEAVLAGLRSQFDQLNSQLSSYGHTAMVQASAGADKLQAEIRRQPLTALAIAAMGGALIAVVVMSGKRAPVTWSDQFHDYRRQADDYGRAVARRLQDTAAQASDAAPGLLSNVERLVGRLSQMDAQATLAPAVEKGAHWMRSLVGQIKNISS